MPITVYPASHPSRAVLAKSGVGPSPDDLLRSSCPREHAKSKGVLQSSFGDLPAATGDASGIQPATAPIVHHANNGLVRAAWDAYAHHNHLRLRPEDVWFSILAQFSFYVNANAEQVRGHFVAHEGKKQLTVEVQGSVASVDFGELAVMMTGEIQKNVSDPELCGWILPDFTTTDSVDVTTAAVLMMGTMQAYFSYRMSVSRLLFENHSPLATRHSRPHKTNYPAQMVTCGIPSVTLLGEREDWVKIRRRVDKLHTFGREPELWASLLIPVLDMFVRCFDEPEGAAVRDFWSRVADHRAGSGFSSLSGWITAFCFWDADGKRQGFRGADDGRGAAVAVRGLGETAFPEVDAQNIPDAFVSVPVEVVEHDGAAVSRQLATRMVAGSVGIRVTSGGEAVGRDTLQPLTGWWMYELKGRYAGEAAQVEPPAGLSGYRPW